jgi:23S rRNA (uracil1939-C5)-methyltransferase
MIKDGLRPDVVVLDPPRKGCEDALVEAVSQSGASRIVYVSCNPATLARDCAKFVEAGYSVGKVQPVDMFPMTGHVECVVLIEKKAP